MNLKPIKVPGEWEKLEYHPLCTMFPEATESEFDNIVSSMETNGYFISDPIIVTHTTGDTMVVLDGRNRHQAAQEARVTPNFLLFEDEDALGFVCSRNIDRRHLTAGQRAALGAEVANLKAGQNPSAEGDISVEEAAKMVGSSTASIKRFRTIRDRDAEIADQVRMGQETLNSAWEKVKKTLDPGSGNGQRPEESTLPSSLTPDPDEPKGSEAYVKSPGEVDSIGGGEEEGEATIFEDTPQAPERPYIPPRISVTIDRGPFADPVDEKAPIIVQVGKSLVRLDKMSAEHLSGLLKDWASRI